MNENVVLLIGQMEIIASLIVIGLVVQKLKLFTSDLIDALSAMMSRLILPLMLMTVIGSISRDDIIHSWRFFVCSVVCYIITVSLSKLLARFSGISEPRRSMHALLMSFGNSGFYRHTTYSKYVSGYGRYCGSFLFLCGVYTLLGSRPYAY